LSAFSDELSLERLVAKVTNEVLRVNRSSPITDTYPSSGEISNGIKAPGTTLPVKTSPPKLEWRSQEEVYLASKKILEGISAAIDQLNKMSINTGRGISFSQDQKLGRNVINVINTSTGELVRTIPTEVAIRVAHGIEDFKGILHDRAI